MPNAYPVLYRLGITPWDSDRVPTPVRELAAAHRAAPGRALDLGCGTGTHALHMAGRGWQVTGLDIAAKPLERARQRAEQAGLSVRWVRGDVTRLADAGVPAGFDVVLDVGCFHGLGPAQRRDYATGLEAVSAPRATLLMLAFSPGFRGPLPRGASAEELTATLAGWTLQQATPDPDQIRLPGPLRGARPVWFRFTRGD